MVKTLRQAFRLIGRGQRARWALLIVLALIASGAEVVGAGLIFVLLSLVADAEADIDLPLVGDVRSLAGDIDDEALLMALVGFMALFFVLRAGMRIVSAYVQARVAHNTGVRLSSRLVTGYLNLPFSMHLRRNSAELIRNSHQAVQEVISQVFLPTIRVLADALLAVGLLLVLVALAPGATAVAVLVIGGTAALTLLLVQPRIKRLGRTAHAMQRETLGVLQQSLHGVRDVKLLGRERYFAKRYRMSRLRLARSRYLKSALVEVPRNVVELALLGFILGFFAVTVGSVDSSVEALSILGLFAYAGMRLLPSIQRIVKGLNELRFASAPIQDLATDLEEVESVGTTEQPHTPLPFTNAVVLSDVSHRYEGADRNSLSNVNLTIPRGEQLGICGPTGGGKTTLVDIVTGLLEPSAGKVLVDGLDVGENARGWQRNLGVVPQMVFLIDDSLRSNIALGVDDSEIDEKAVEDAVDLAQLRGFVDSLPLGLDTHVGERGVRISGGQRQRIAIARALYRRPEVLIFDEGTSSLDNTTEADLMAAINRLRGEHTIILVAHRLSTVRDSDHVVFVEDGQITGEGTYDELLSGHASFRTMAEATP